MLLLSYHCGSAREFFYPDGSQSASQEMSCQWDKSWSPSATLGTCDWVACLQPPLPPPSSNLRVTGWFGDPIAFGSQVVLVCDKGLQFEQDPSQTEVRYTCQDGKQPGFEDYKGFFDVPASQEEWPRCVLGKNCSVDN